MKHVWIINHYAQEPGGTGATRHFSLAKNLRAHGWKATIIAASTEHLSRKQRLGSHETARLDHFEGIPFLWLRTPEYSGNGMDRIRNMLTYTVRVLQPGNLSKLEPPDVIIGSSVHPFAAWAGLRQARRHRVPFVFEVRDLWPEALIDMGRLKEGGMAAFLMRKLEKKLYLSAKKIIVLWPYASTYIQSLGIETEKVVWLSNGVDMAEWPADAPPPGNDRFTLMYFGAHGGANGLDNVIRAMRIVLESQTGADIRLRLVGNGPQKAQLRKLANEIGATNVIFEDPVPKKSIPGLAAEADAFVFNLIDAPMFKYGISPNKLYDFMAARRPTVFCCQSANNPIDESGGGITVEPGKPDELAKAILKLASLPPAERNRMGAAARCHVEQYYSYGALAQRLATTLDECLPHRVNRLRPDAQSRLR